MYLLDFFQHQQTDPSPLIFDVHLTELMPVDDNEAHFSNYILVAHPVKEIINSARRSLLERVIEVDVYQLAVSDIICRLLRGPKIKRKRDVRRTLSTDLPSCLYVIL